ncbi:MAG: hypothetical protein S4CHLAM2_11580 [Chlamydiales bacterium]|nr:hypothetical protein [Chlamydiales bacterium]
MIVKTGETETTPVTLPDDGDQALVQPRGTLMTTAVVAIAMGADNQRAENQGTISTSGVGAHGMQSLAGLNALLRNNGFIETAGGVAFGLSVGGANGIIENFGSIFTADDLSAGLRSDGIDTTVTNTGTVLTIGNNADAILVNRDRARVLNSGLASTTGMASDGVLVDGPSTSVRNTGLITAIGTGSFGIEGSVNAVDLVVANSGTIQGAAAAITLQGTNPTLNLLKGSNLQGLIEAGNPLNVGVETGLNLALNLNSGSYGSLAISAPFAQVGAVLGVIDPTGLAMQTDLVADFSDAVLGGIYQHRLGGCCDPCGCGIWIQGIGSTRHRGALSDSVAYDNRQGGFLLGSSVSLSAGYASVFVGATYGQATVDKNTQKTDLTNYVAGFTYETRLCNTYMGMALALGYLDWENRRYIQNNLVPGGVEKAHVDLDAFFISPEITLGHAFNGWWREPVLSVTLRYAGAFFGDYTESGSQTNLSVKNREVDLITARFEAALPYSCMCCWDWEPYIGLLGRYQVGGCRIDTELLGEPVSLVQPGAENLAAFLVGFRSEARWACFDLFVNLEASFDTQSSTRFLGEGGIGYVF